MKSSFPKKLKHDRKDIYDKEQKHNEKRNQYPHFHIQDPNQRGEKSSKGKRSAIPHKNLGRIDIVKHKGNQSCHQNTDDRTGNISPITKSHNAKDKENDSHKPTCQSIKPISDVDGIDDTDGDKKSDNRIEQSQLDFPCQRPEIDEINP